MLPPLTAIACDLVHMGIYAKVPTLGTDHSSQGPPLHALCVAACRAFTPLSACACMLHGGSQHAHPCDNQLICN